MSPTLMCTRSRSSRSILAWVPLPLPCTPMITYLRIDFPSVRRAEAQRAGREPGQRGRIDAPGAGHPEHVTLGDQHRCLLVELAGQPGVTLGLVRLAEPGRDLTGLPHIPK